jgi:hypothetical protein
MPWDEVTRWNAFCSVANREKTGSGGGSFMDKTEGCYVVVDAIVVLLSVQEGNECWLSFLAEDVIVEAFSYEQVISSMSFSAAVLFGGEEIVFFASVEYVA